MNEPKKRGLPPKVAVIEEPMVVSATSEAVAKADVKFDGSAFEGRSLSEQRKQLAQDLKTWAIQAAAQAYAERVWSGQSPDVSRKERLERVRKALEGQGLFMDGVTL